MKPCNYVRRTLSQLRVFLLVGVPFICHRIIFSLTLSLFIDWHRSYFATNKGKNGAGVGLELLAPVEFWVENRNSTYHFKWNRYGENQ